MTPMPKSLLAKLGVKDGVRSILVNAPAGAVKAISLSNENQASRLSGRFGYIHVFVTDSRDLDSRFPALKRHLQETGMLWVSWPKAKLLGTDLSLTKIIEIGYRHGLVESKTISIDSTWSAIKFTFPKKGKEYHNSYGQLPRGATDRERSQ